MKYLLFFAVFILLLPSCREKSPLEIEVMAIHDEVMPKMGDLHVAKKNLRKLISETNSDSLNTIILDLITDLENADEGMMSWMHEYKVPNNDPEKTVYLEKEKVNITKVKEDMLNSLKAAHDYLAAQNK